MLSNKKKIEIKYISWKSFYLHIAGVWQILAVGNIDHITEIIRQPGIFYLGKLPVWEISIFLENFPRYDQTRMEFVLANYRL